MLSQSIPLMTLFDLAFLGIVLYAGFRFIQVRPNVAALEAKAGFTAILFGLTLVALFYLLDLLVMHIGPVFMAEAQAMRFMEDLHLNHRWWISLLSICAIALGCASAIQNMAKLNDQHSLSRQELEIELASRRETERALRDSQDELKKAQRLGKIGNWRWSIKRNELISCSEEFAKIHGVGLDQIQELLAHEMEHVIHPEDRSRVAAEYKRFDEDGTDYEIEYRIHRADGEVRHVLEIGAAIFDRSGFPCEHVGTLQDITDRVAAEESRRHSEACLRAILDNAPAEIHLKDRDGRYILVNRYCQKLWNLSPGSAVGKLPSELAHPEDLGRAARADDLDVLRSGESREIEYETAFSDGVHTIRYLKFPIRDEGEEIIGLGGIATDVTEQKRIEEELLESQELARLASRAKSEFLATMSHELRTPLNAIIGFSEMIRDEVWGEGPAKHSEYAEDIHFSGQHLLSLINDILDLSKVESGHEELRDDRVTLPALLEAVDKLVRHRAEQGGIRLELRVPRDLPGLEADERKMKQILVNLITNAIKFTEPGGRVILEVWYRRDSGFVFQISDSGIGIARKDIPKVLAQFGQVDNPFNRSHKGTGLGLPLSKSLAELHGGSLDLQSQPGEGTTVTVRLPADRKLPTSAEDTNERQAPRIAS